MFFFFFIIERYEKNHSDYGFNDRFENAYCRTIIITTTDIIATGHISLQHKQIKNIVCFIELLLNRMLLNYKISLLQSNVVTV